MPNPTLQSSSSHTPGGELPAPGAPILLCATRAEAAPVLKQMSLKTRIPGTKLYLVWGKLHGSDPFIVGVSGMGGARAARMTRYVVDNLQPSWLIWFGVAGGLLPGFSVGDLVVPAKIRLDDRDYVPTTAPRDWIVSLVHSHRDEKDTGPLKPSEGTIIEVPHVIGGTKEKAELGRTSGAVACDMESGSFAEVASKSPYPWAVVRTIFDRVEDELPVIPENILDDTGAVRPLAAAREFFKMPRALWELGQRNRSAVKILGPILALTVTEYWRPGYSRRAWSGEDED